MSESYNEPIVMLDLGQRTVEEGYIASIESIAEILLNDNSTVTEDARTWAEDMTSQNHLYDYIQNAGDDEDTIMFLDEMLTQGVNHLYETTQLHAFTDSGYFYIVDEESELLNNW